MNKTLKYLLRLIIGVIILLALTGYKSWLHILLYGDILANSGPFDTAFGSIMLMIVIWLISIAAGLYQIALFVLYLVSLCKNSPPSIVLFLEDGLINIIISRSWNKLSAPQRKWFSVSGWGIFIFVFVVLLSTYHAFENSESIFLRSNYIKHLYSKKVLEKYEGEEGFNKYLIDEPVRYLNFMTIDNNFVKYMNSIYQIAKDLKDVGAKVVVAEIPRGISYPLVPRNRLHSKIDSLHIVVWVDQPPPIVVSNDKIVAIKYYSPKVKLRGLGAYRMYTVETDPTNSLFDVNTQLINCWYPCLTVASRMERTPQTVRSLQLDGALEVAKKYYDYPDTCIITLNENSVSIGNQLIPVSSTGAAYSNNIGKLFYRFPIYASRGLDFTKDSELTQDRVIYHMASGMGSYSYAYPRDTMSNLSEIKNYFNGKVIVINWMNNNGELDLGAKLQAANVISSVLRNDHFKMINWLTYLLAFISTTVIASISPLVKVKWILAGSFLAMVCIALLSVWIFLGHKILFDPIYPIISIAISAILFSLLKITREYGSNVTPG